MNPYARDVTRLGPEISQVLDVKDLRSVPLVESDQYRLWQGVGLIIRSAARSGPLVLVLDDLQWADAGSSGLVGVLGQEVGSLPVLLLGAYRQEEVSDDDPLRRNRVW